MKERAGIVYMSERFMLLGAGLVAIVGLCILFALRPEASEGFRLEGTVVAVRGTHATLTTNVTLIARDVERGERFSGAVFWSGDAFVAIPDERD